MARWAWLGVTMMATAVACGGTNVTGSTTGTTGSQANLPAGSPCGSNGDCFSQICGLTGTGYCCSKQCTSDGTPCGIADCDTTGSCIKAYAGTSCDTCTGNTYTPGACNGSGTCEAGLSSACAGDLICNAAGTGCVRSCAKDTDCDMGFYCNAGACAAKVATGACTSNHACTSDVCGVGGTGHCCTAACTSVTAPCGATDCDALTGACVFPDTSVTCGSTQQSCSGTTQTNATVCDGMGNCPSAGTTDCTPFICGANACLTTCSDASSCAGSGDFCDTTRGACCAPLSSGDTLTVNSLMGSDEIGCCGIGNNQPCQTLTHAMKLVNLTQAKNVTLLATVGDGGGDWMPSGEKYPIVLGWGVELNAPGVYFWDPNGTGSPGTFLIEGYSPSDTVGYASIAGIGKKLPDGGLSAPIQIGIGMDKEALHQSLAYGAIQIDPGETLYIANTYVNGNASAFTNAFTIEPGGSLVLGQDKSGAITGTVNIGNGNGDQTTDGYDGIYCRTDNVGKGCTVTDAPLFGQNSVIIQGQEAGDILAYDFSTITLTSYPIIGVSPGAPGFAECTYKPDCSSLKYTTAGAVYLVGKATATLRNAAIHCISANGISMLSSNHGTPTLLLDSSSIRNTETALQVSAGTATVWNSTIEFNYNGVIQAAGFFGAPGGSVDLNGGDPDGGTDGGNTIICHSNEESIYGQNALVGVNVENQSALPLDAANVTWDTASPDHFSCKMNLTNCVCSLDAGTCANPPAGNVAQNGMDAVTLNGPVITTGNKQSSLATQRGCK